MNFDRWGSLFSDTHNPPWHMDWRHVEMIHAVLCNELPASVVEIGTYRGASTAAIVEAMETYPQIEHATLVDYAFQMPAWVTQSVARNVSMYAGDSSGIRGLKADCWIIDGDHGEGAHRDLATALMGDARIIFVHDTHTKNMGVTGHDGAAAIAADLKRDHATLEDNAFRVCELTHRGLLVAFIGCQPKPETVAAWRALQ